MIQQNQRSKFSLKIAGKILGAVVACALAGFSVQAQLVRQANTSMDFPDVTPSTGELVLSNALPGVTLHRPVAVATPPGETNRLFIVERNGRILVVTNLANPTSAETFLDIRSRVHASSWAGSNLADRRTEGLSSVAFHPGFAMNGRFFVTYNTVTNTTQGEGHHNRIAEFRASADRSMGLPDSEIPLITQFDEGAGHNFNDLHFGPDGYLYVALGDEGDGGTGDDYNNAQKIDKDFFAGIIRIDVDSRPGNLAPNSHPASHGNYKIPADNPFVGASSFLGQPIDPPKVRTEFYAIGLRNVWRISFDPQTGELYAGDVGQHHREEINRIVKGGNYGWAFKQGTLTGPKGAGPSGAEFIDPIWEYSPDQGRSVTGGVVYRGSRLPSLRGHLIFADFERGNVWAMNVETNSSPRPQRILGEQFLAGFGYDPRNGDILFVKHGNPENANSGQILRLTTPTVIVEFPAKLSQTGIFSDLVTLRPQAGIYPFEINLPFWSDGAIKSRWFSLPNLNSKFNFRPEQNWTLPAGAVWIKHFDLETTEGSPATRKKIETRVLVRTATGGYGLTYKWNEAGTDADLVPDEGELKEFAVTRNGTAGTQVWQYPSRQDCLRCHTAGGGFALGFNTPQLNREVTHGNQTTNQLAHLAHAGFLDNAPDGFHGLRTLAQPDDTSVSLLYRVKSYLAANCANCHQPGGNAQLNALWDGRITTPFSQANILWGMLFNSTDPNEKVVTPGRPDRSGLLRRISTLDHRDRMPPIGSTVIDQKAVDLLTQWIVEETPRFEGYNQWIARVFPPGQTNTAATADPDGDGASNYAEYLIGSHPLQADSKLTVVGSSSNGQAVLTYTNPPNRAILWEAAPNATSTNWTLLQSPSNQMQFPASATQRKVVEPATGSQRIYRARVIEP